MEALYGPDYPCTSFFFQQYDRAGGFFSDDIITTRVDTLMADTLARLALSLILLLLSCGSCLFNQFIFRYYLPKRSRTIHLVYVYLSVCDASSGLAALLNCAALIFLKRSYLIRVLIACTFFLTSLTAHVSVFYNVVLVCVRTQHIVLPCRRINRVAVRSALLVYPVGWVLLTLAELYARFHVFRVNNTTDKLIDRFLVVPLRSNVIFWGSLKTCLYLSHNLYAILMVGIPYILPCLISSSCLAVQVWCLAGGRGTTHSRISRKITGTVVLLTLTYLICNISYFLTLLLVDPNTRIPQLSYYAMYGAGVLLPFLNATANPAILLYRGRLLGETGYIGFIRRIPVKRQRNEGTQSRPGERRATPDQDYTQSCWSGGRRVMLGHGPEYALSDEVTGPGMS